MNFIMTLDVNTVIRLIKRAFNKSEEEKYWMLYSSVYPHFDKKNFKKFNDFYKAPAETISTRSADDILSKAESILKKAGEKGGVI